tara:strand:+ start:379 stop:519 length:141 start_codon:yes stop_codon:yes gene_type:complete
MKNLHRNMGSKGIIKAGTGQSPAKLLIVYDSRIIKLKVISLTISMN